MYTNLVNATLFCNRNRILLNKNSFFDRTWAKKLLKNKLHTYDNKCNELRNALVYRKKYTGQILCSENDENKCHKFISR